MTLKERVEDFIHEYKMKGYYITKHHTIKDKKINQYGREYQYPISEIVSIRVPMRAGNIREFFYVIIFRNKWFEHADGANYLNNPEYRGEKYMIADHKIFQWIRNFNRPTETIITLAFPDYFLYVRWYEILKKSRKIDPNDGVLKTIFYPHAFQVALKNTEVCLVHESLFVNKNPYDILKDFESDELIIGEEIDLNSYLYT